MKISQRFALSSLNNYIKGGCRDKEIPQLALDYHENRHKNNKADLIVQGELNDSKILGLLRQDKKLHLQIGVDEAGRGPLLGSVMIGAVILPPEYTENMSELSQIDLSNTPLSKLNDSKKISEKKRNEIYEVLPSIALGFVSVEVPFQVIDDINILQASLQGMRVAVNELLENISALCRSSDRGNLPIDNLSLPSNHLLSSLSISLLFDGNKLPVLDFDNYHKWGYNIDELKASSEVKGDGRFASVAAASIIAKVERDKQMYAMAKIYPQYGIENHKGYPTKAHFEALEKSGVLPEHRRSFAPVKRLVESTEV